MPKKRTKRDDADTVRVSCAMPRSLHRAFKAKLRRLGMPNRVSDTLLYLVRLYVSESPERLKGGTVKCMTGTK